MSRYRSIIRRRNEMMNRVNRLYQRRHQTLWLHHMMSVEQARHLQENDTTRDNRPDNASATPDWQEDTR